MEWAIDSQRIIPAIEEHGIFSIDSSIKLPNAHQHSFILGLFLAGQWLSRLSIITLIFDYPSLNMNKLRSSLGNEK
jgi:hypothetical protein